MKQLLLVNHKSYGKQEQRKKHISLSESIIIIITAYQRTRRSATHYEKTYIGEKKTYNKT
jgi:hypothetical protein